MTGWTNPATAAPRSPEVTQQHSLLHEIFRGLMTLSFSTGLVVIGRAWMDHETLMKPRTFERNPQNKNGVLDCHRQHVNVSFCLPQRNVLRQEVSISMLIS